MKKPLMMLILTGCLLAAGTSCLRGQEENTPAPPFTLKDLAGNTLDLSAYRGKVLVLNFWATWCPPCRAEIPDFIDAYKELGPKGLEIIGVSTDQMSTAKLREWVSGVGINYPVAPADRKIIEDYRPGEYIPATIMIDKKGRIRYRHVGAMEKS
ncbi:MAG TPA: TlpA disulfide reductase family protein, partial [Acidobacteriota bacterium]|nr:TlpA disulfide reductase family protein [Acidobacteriota bacterium]